MSRVTRFIAGWFLLVGLAACSSGPIRPAPTGDASSQQSDAEQREPAAPHAPTKKRYEPVNIPSKSAEVAEKPRENPAIKRLQEKAKRLSEEGDQRAASDFLERALRLEPNNPTLWHNLAIVKYRANVYPQAIAFAEKSIQLAGQDAELKRRNYLLISECYRMQSKPDLAEQARRKAAELE